MKYRYRHGVTVVRGQPVTLAHGAVVAAGLQECEELVVVNGSSFAARRWDHVPFREFEREEMWRRMLPPEQLRRVKFVNVMDYGNISQWQAAVHDATRDIVQDDPTALVGHKKDQPTGYYLSQFPDWESVEVPNFRGINATYARDKYIVEDQRLVSEFLNGEATEYLAPGVIAFLQEFRQTPEYLESLLAEKVFMQNYLGQWDSAPYPPIFYTADSVVRQARKVLLVQRGGFPGKGLWAVPGGHCENQTAADAAIKELYEETRLKVARETLRNSIIGEKTYDDPNRSTRKRTVSHTTFINLTPKIPPGVTDITKVREALAYPKVRAASDAKRAVWKDPDTIPRYEYFEDHWKMISDSEALIKKV